MLRIGRILASNWSTGLRSLIVLVVVVLRGQSQALSDAHLLLVRGRGRLFAVLLRVLELSVQISIDTQRLNLLVILNL